MRQFSEAEVAALERLDLHGSDSPISPLRTALAPSKINADPQATSVPAAKVDIGLLEEKAAETSGNVNGHA